MLTLRLEPATLGQVEVRITRPTDGSPGVQVTATEPQTLLLLVRDQPQLQQALDRAGIAVDSRNFSFHLAPPLPAPTTTAAASGGAVSQGSTGAGTGNAAPRDNTPRRRRLTAAASPDSVRGAALSRAPGAGWLRAGLDITA